MSWKCFDCFRNQVEDVHVLDYQHCMLYDVPIEVFAYERTLEELKLDANRIRDLPRPLFHCHGLKILSLSDNDIQNLPPAVASLINLQQLDLSRNALAAIPDNIKCCKQLHCVDVSINPLEKLPEGFTQLINLEELYLNDTYLDFLPANFGRLTRLKILELRENNLNTLPKSIARLLKLERLDLGQNEFSDMPEAVGSLTNLVELWIDCNRIKNIAPLIGNLKKLVHFDASNNNINWISPLIEKCERLVDLTLSCNEIQEIPSTIGNLKELITLKLDDNQLRTVPSSIGNLPFLQELILSQNNIQSLPCTVGLLRRLHILNVDDNVLEDLPAEVGSCSSLTLLSVRNNKLQEVPAELGHLQRIKVINLSDNLLRNLPVSILKLTHLNALWLSNNQTTPLTILQKEFDRDTGQTVCVNFMLPQTPQDSVTVGQYTEPDEAPVRSRPHIRFAIEVADEEPNHLLRAPTPYPKELRAMAKHARAIHQGPKRAFKEVSEDAPLLGKMRAPWPSDVQIKEAKVKKPETFSLSEQSKPALFPALSVCESIQETSLHVAENRPVIREAKYVRQRTSAAHLGGNKLGDEVLQQSHISMPSSMERENLRLSIASSFDHPLQPPPYHIAAAYSKQAKWFEHVNPQTKIENWTNNLCYDFGPSSISENKSVSDIHSPSSLLPGKNGPSFQSALEVIGSDNISLWSSHPNDTDACEDDIANAEIKAYHEDLTQCEEVTAQCVDNSLSETCSEQNVQVKSDITNISSHFDDHGTNHKIESFGTKSCAPQLSSNLLVEDLHHEAGVNSPEKGFRTLENLSLATPDNGRENLLNIVDDALHVCHISSLDDGVIHSCNLDTLVNGTVPYVKEDLIPTFDKYAAVVTQSISHVVLTSPEAENGINSTYFSPSQIKNSSHFVNQPHVASDMNELAFPVSCEISIEVPSALRMPDGKYSESHVYTHCNGQFLNSEALSNSAVYGNGCDRQVPYNHNVFSHIAPVSKSGNNIDTSFSIISPVVHSFEPSYHQDSAGTILTSPVKNIKVSPSATSSRGSSKLWRFGLHRNPTVLPILIHKTEDLGFVVNGNVDMSLLPENQKGIFIVSVNPNGPASGLLLPGDKILEVDGTDFSKISNDEAVRILQQTGNVVHMMISRQQ